MVRLSMWLCRVPVIKFRKGGSGQQSQPSAPATSPGPRAGSCAMPPPQAQPAAAMSTGAAIPDIDLPARYRRTPLSEEEIDHINGGGIKDDRPRPQQEALPKALGIIRVPKGVLIDSGRKKEVVSLNIILQRLPAPAPKVSKKC